MWFISLGRINKASNKKKKLLPSLDNAKAIKNRGLSWENFIFKFNKSSIFLCSIFSLFLTNFITENTIIIVTEILFFNEPIVKLFIIVHNLNYDPIDRILPETLISALIQSRRVTPDLRNLCPKLGFHRLLDKISSNEREKN